MTSIFRPAGTHGLVMDFPSPAGHGRRGERGNEADSPDTQDLGAAVNTAVSLGAGLVSDGWMGSGTPRRSRCGNRRRRLALLLPAGIAR